MIIKLLFSRSLAFIFTYFIRKRLLSCGSIKVNGVSRIPKGLVSVGHNVNFNGMIIKGKGLVKIGNDFHSGEQCKILTSSHNWKGSKLPYDSTHIIKETVIGDCVWLGDNVILLPGVTLGNGVIVQAGSVVHGDVPAYTIIGGNPGVKIGERDSSGFQRLYASKKFH